MALKLVIRARGRGGLGTKTSCVFGTEGGTIGRGMDCTWVLVDPQNEVSSLHATIVHEGGQFCLIDQSTNGVYVNGARDPLGRGVKVALRHGDTLRIGKYEIAAIIGTGVEDVQTDDLSVADGYGLTDLVAGGSAQEAEDGLGSDDHDDDSHGFTGGGASASGGRRDSARKLDPLAAFAARPEPGTRPRAAEPGADGAETGVAARPLTAGRAAEEDAAGDVTGHFRPQAISGVPVTEQDFEAYLEGIAATGGAAPPSGPAGRPPLTASRGGPDAEPRATGGSADASIHAIDSAMTTLSPRNHNLWPLFKALGLTDVPIPDERIPGLLADIGAALRQAIDGLHAAYSDGGDGSHLRIAAARLQPLEDNPVKFSEDGQAAVTALFGNRSAVHLGPEDAVRECLDGLHVHRGATAAGTAAGLQAVIASFSPEALARRFAKYSPDREIRQDGAWLWGMFEQYFDEVRRNRSHGLRRLFDEVSAQHYDQHVRASLGPEGEAVPRPLPEDPRQPARQQAWR